MSRNPTQTPRRPAAPSTARGSGARTADRGGAAPRRRRLGWLWALLGLLAVGLIIAALAGAFSNDDGAAKKASGGTAGSALTAGGTALLPPPANGLKPLVGKTATADDVVVQSVVQNSGNPDVLEGFWVGKSKSDRVYVEWGGDVGRNEADFRPKVGEHVGLTGPVRPAPVNPRRALNLDADDAALVRSQGGYVNADDVKAAG